MLCFYKITTTIIKILLYKNVVKKFKLFFRGLDLYLRSNSLKQFYKNNLFGYLNYGIKRFLNKI